MNGEQVLALRHARYGNVDVPGVADIESSWKVVKALAAGDGELRGARRECLLARMVAAGTPPEVIERVMAWNHRSERAEALLARGGPPSRLPWCTRAWLIYEALSVRVVDGHPAPNELEAVRSVAARVDVPPETVDALAEVCFEEASLRRRRIDLLASECAASFRYDLL